MTIRPGRTNGSANHSFLPDGPVTAKAGFPFRRPGAASETHRESAGPFLPSENAPRTRPR